MTLAPRILVSFMAGLRTTRFAQQLKLSGNGVAAQQAVFKKLLASLAGTQLGQRQGLSVKMDYDEFRQS